MKVSVSDAKEHLTELVRRAEAGEEVILTQRGHGVVRLVPVMSSPESDVHRALLERIRAAGSAKARSGPEAARSQDFLYGDKGMTG